MTGGRYERLAAHGKQTLAPLPLGRAEAFIEESNSRYNVAMQRLERVDDVPAVGEEGLHLSVVVEAHGLLARLRMGVVVQT